MNGNSYTDSTPYVGCCCRVDPDGAKASHPNSRHLKGVSRAWNQDSIRYDGTACRPGPGASGSGPGFRQHRCAADLSVWLLRLRAIRLLALWLLRARILLQRHLPGHGPVGWLGLRPRLGRPSICKRRRRQLSRRRRRSGQSQQFCTRRSRRRPSPHRHRGVSFRRSAPQRGSRCSGAHQCSALAAKLDFSCPSFTRNS
jgi:hypothetical protein